MTINDYVDYWNKWMKEWYDAAFNARSGGVMPSTISGWGVLNVNGGVPNDPSWCFFPEPYWGNPLSDKLGGVFINFNPGQGGASQHIDRAIEYTQPNTTSPNYPIWNNFIPSNYYDTIQNLYNIPSYPTTKWMKGGKREGFIKKVCIELDTNSEFVMFELCPWHTKSVTNDVYNYMSQNSNLINDYILKFAILCSINTQGCFKNVILSHGLDEGFMGTSMVGSDFTFSETVFIGTNLQQQWTVDIFKAFIHEQTVYLINFKNSSNSFPAVNDELTQFFDERDWD